MAPKMAGSMQGQSVLHSPACERKREPILAMPTNNLILIFQLEDSPARQKMPHAPAIKTGLNSSLASLRISITTSITTLILLDQQRRSIALIKSP